MKLKYSIQKNMTVLFYCPSTGMYVYHQKYFNCRRRKLKNVVYSISKDKQTLEYDFWIVNNVPINLKRIFVSRIKAVAHGVKQCCTIMAKLIFYYDYIYILIDIEIKVTYQGYSLILVTNVFIALKHNTAFTST